MSKLKIKNGSTWEEIPAGGVGVPSGGTAGQVLMKSSSTDYADEWADISEAGAMSKWDLLWTNASPTSSFAAQTVSLDLSGYDVIAVVFTGENGNGRRMLFSLIDGNEYASNFVTIVSGTVYTKQRLYNTSSTGIQFGGNYQDGSSGTNDTQNVPTAIYGIKGVST